MKKIAVVYWSGRFSPRRNSTKICLRALMPSLSAVPLWVRHSWRKASLNRCLPPARAPFRVKRSRFSAHTAGETANGCAIGKVDAAPQERILRAKALSATTRPTRKLFPLAAAWAQFWRRKPKRKTKTKTKEVREKTFSRTSSAYFKDTA